MSKNILGIDLGTSSVKLILRYKDGNIKKSKASYSEKKPKGWIDAIKEAAEKLDLSELDGIGLSSQVGTYIINDKDVIGWDSGAGKEEVEISKSRYSKETFIKEIAMPHPDISSYPIPRLMYIKKHYKDIKSICQPKDYICESLTGNRITDKYSFRGLIHTLKGEYSDFFLNEIGIDKDLLPSVVSPEDMIGTTTEECEKNIGIPKNIPVFAGLNDFFSSVVGMGITDSNVMFDITGTSEHLGIINDILYPDTKMVSGVYFDKYIHYGVTASSGASMDFCLANFDTDLDPEAVLGKNPPIFLPYLNGERAPVFDSNAKGMFFGITKACGKKEMAYAVMEGIAFSLWHIYENLSEAKPSRLTVSGGGAVNTILNRLKAELFDIPVVTLCENDTSALGAVILSAIGCGEFGDIFEAAESLVKTDLEFLPTGKFRSVLLKRFETYKKLYPRVKDLF